MKRNYWTKEKCFEVALLCTNRTEFSVKYSRAYNLCISNKWLDDACSHIILKQKKHNYWTKEKCFEVALTCLSKVEFKKEYSRAFKLCRINGWLDDACLHMKEVHKKHNYWTKEKCFEVALNCHSKFEFQKLFPSAYDKSLNNNWLNDVCSHMIRIGNCKRRCIYLSIFSDKYAYVGLTYNFNIRKKSHLTDIKSPIFNHIKETNLIPQFKQLTDYVDVDLASKYLENFYKTYYEGMGYNMLNIAKTGGIGSNKSKYTKEMCRYEALKYKYRSDFSNKSSSFYNVSCKNKWMNDICSHMVEVKKPKNYWTKENCIKYANLCNYLIEFKNRFSGAYTASYKKGWIHEITKHMDKPKPHNYKWKKEECKKEYFKFNDIDNFKKYSKYSYQSVINNKWEDIFI